MPNQGDVYRGLPSTGEYFSSNASNFYLGGKDWKFDYSSKLDCTIQWFTIEWQKEKGDKEFKIIDRRDWLWDGFLVLKIVLWMLHAIASNAILSFNSDILSSFPNGIGEWFGLDG